MSVNCVLVSLIFVAQGCNAFPQNKQGGVNVSRFLEPLPEGLGFIASFRAGQITQRKPMEQILTFKLDNVYNTIVFFKQGFIKDSLLKSTHSEILSTVLPLILSSFMVKMQWLYRESKIVSPI